MGYQTQSEEVFAQESVPTTPKVLGAATSTLPEQEEMAATSTDQIATTTSTVAQTAPAFPSNLRFGMRGEGVARLQAVLIGEKYLEISVPTGWFGPLTLGAVRRYQAVWGIMPTGFVGPVTRAWLTVRISETASDSD